MVKFPAACNRILQTSGTNKRVDSPAPLEREAALDILASIVAKMKAESAATKAAAIENYRLTGEAFIYMRNGKKVPVAFSRRTWDEINHQDTR